MRVRPVDRVWDIADVDAARAFLAADGLTDLAPTLPFPCRAARLAGDAPGAGRPPSATPDPRVCRLEAPDGLILAGPAGALAEAAESLPEAAASRLRAALGRYERPTSSITFADGATWHLEQRSRVMGILNVTPDSFSDGGLYADPERALDRAEQMAAEGADCIDVGGESTRPGADAVDPSVEARRVVPVVAAIRERCPGLRVSVDTRRAAVARRALDAGADIVNDVTGLADPAMAPLVAERRCPVVLMHMRGTPRTMQLDTTYDDLLGEVLAGLASSLQLGLSAGIRGDRILVDPGFGFGKSPEGNEEILRQLATIRSLGQPILVGLSRKSFIGRLTGVDDGASRLAGSLAAATAAVVRGARVVRAHDVRETRQALAVADAARHCPPVSGAKAERD